MTRAVVMLAMGLAMVTGGAVRAQAQTQAQSQALVPDLRLLNADVRTVPASGSLATQVKTLASQQTEPGWIGYVQTPIDSHMNACCYNSYNDGNGNNCCGACRLDRESDQRISRTSTTESSTAKPIHLEGSPQFLILLRVEDQQIVRLRIFSSDCELEAGGRRITLISGVTPAASIGWLESLVRDEPPANAESEGRRNGKRRDPLGDGAISAIAWHRDSAAEAALDRLVSPSRPTEIRRKATFWLANTRGKHGFDVANRLAHEDADAGVRKHAVFALTVTKEPGATPALIDLARHSTFTEVRSEAIFWLAQVAGRQAAPTITEAIDKDPETEVKKKAVFALSQLPKDEGVPLLIDVAKKNQNPAVRKQAMFWLGQSKDPRALDFFESVLKQ